MAVKGYTTKEAIENYLLTDIDDEFDDQLNEWIETVELYIDHETNRDFTPVVVDQDDSTLVYDGDGTNTLNIDPVQSVTSIKLSPTGTALEETNYYLYPSNKAQKTKIQLYGLVFPKGNQNILVTGVFGFAAVPADIKFVATVLVAGIINQSWDTGGEIQSLTIGRYSVTYKTKEQINDFSKVDEILQFNKKYEF